LIAEQLQSGYGASQVLFGVDLTIAANQVVSLLGRNGMGKTTTVRTLMGMLPLKSGVLTLDGQDLRGYRPHRISRLGVGLVPEGRHVFPSLSVYENLYATSRSGSRPGSNSSNVMPWTLERVFALFPRLRERTRQSARTLSGGEQQMLAIGRALLTNPRLLILDEATEGLAPLVREDIWNVVRRLCAAQQAILIVDKNLRVLSELCTRHVVLERGRTVWHGDSQALAADLDVVSRYLSV